jgi:hypothetical protein
MMHSALTGIIHPEYIRLATEIKCLCRLEAEIDGKTCINSRHFKHRRWRPNPIWKKVETLFSNSVHHIKNKMYVNLQNNSKETALRT